MIGIAKSIKTKVVFSHYDYPNADYSISNRKWVTLDQEINKALLELGTAEVINIKFVSQAHGDGELHESALIIYKEGEST